MNLFYQPLIPEGVHYLDEEESRHCVKVLRRNTGDTIKITDGKGFFYNCVITNADAKKCAFKIVDKHQEKPRDYSIHIAISPTKNPDRIEWFTEKAVEFGIDRITLLQCDNSEKSYLKTERLRKMAVSAMKQSLKASLPQITEPTPFQKFIASENADEKFIAFVDESNPDHLNSLATRNKSAIVLIGPEGDFSKEELATALENDYRKVSLGNSRLRTETAGVAACHILNLINS